MIKRGKAKQLGNNLYQLTSAAFAGYKVSVMLQRPFQALRPRVGTPLQDQTLLELFMGLRESGWVRDETAVTQAQQRKKPPYSTGAPKVFYAVGRQYMFTLANADSLGCEVHHGQCVAYYEALARGEQPQPKQKASAYKQIGRPSGLQLKDVLDDEDEARPVLIFRAQLGNKLLR